ncbi:MAG: ATP-binding protein [Planctomycetota bacterium]
MGEPAHITLTLRSDPKYLAGAREMMSSVARRLGFDEISCSQIALAVDEALCNVIRHGYDRRQDAPIWLRLWPQPTDDGQPGLRVEVEDEAKQVDPSSMKGRNLDDIRPGGLGVHIIREVMDDVVYEQREGGVGMRLVLIKQGNVKPAMAAESSCDAPDRDTPHKEDA